MNPFFFIGCDTSLTPQELPYLVDAATFAAKVNSGMAIGANWPQIGNRVHLVFLANLRQGLEVVNVDEPLCDRPIGGAEVEAAYYAGRAMVGDATSAGDWVTLIGVDDDLADGTLNHGARKHYFLGQPNRTGSDPWKRESL